MSEHCNFLESIGPVQRKDIPRVIAEALEHAQSLPEFDARDNSAADGSLGTTSDGGGSSSEAVPSSQCHTVCSLMNSLGVFL